MKGWIRGPSGVALTFIVVVATTMSAEQRRPAGASAAARAEMLATQVLLDRAGFSPGEIDGLGGANTQRAIDAFEREKGGSVAQLAAAATEPQTIRYTVTADDLATAIVKSIPEDMM